MIFKTTFRLRRLISFPSSTWERGLDLARVICAQSPPKRNLFLTTTIAELIEALEVLRPATAYRNRHPSILLAWDATLAAIDEVAASAA